jgi:hypothetical protein
MDLLGIAALTVKLGFPVYLAWTYVSGALSTTATIIFLAIGVATWLGLPRLIAPAYVTAAFGLLDIALVLAVFNGDNRQG